MHNARTDTQPIHSLDHIERLKLLPPLSQCTVRNLGVRIGLVPILPGIRPGFDSYLGRDSSPRPPVWSARTHREGVPVAGACQWMMNRRASAGG